MIHDKTDIYTHVFRLTGTAARMRGFVLPADTADALGMKIIGVYTICGPP